MANQKSPGEEWESAREASSRAAGADEPVTGNPSSVREASSRAEGSALDEPVTARPIEGRDIPSEQNVGDPPVSPRPISGWGIPRTVQESRDWAGVDSQPPSSPIQGPAAASGMRVPGVENMNEGARGQSSDGRGRSSDGHGWSSDGREGGARWQTGSGKPSMVPRRRGGRGALKWLIGAAILAVLLVVGFVVPMPYVISKPGPTFDVTGSIAGYPVLEIDSPDAVTHSNGQLRMVTVTSYGGPSSNVSLAQIVQAWFTEGYLIEPEEAVYPSNISREELQEISKIQMTSSQSTAAAVALEELGYDVSATMTIAGAVAGSHAEGLVQEGDILVAITTPDGVRHEVDKPSVPFTLPKDLPPETPVKIEVLRDGQTEIIDMKTYLPNEGEPATEGSKFGIYLTADVDLPFDVNIHLEEVGGPSAGMMFALGIIDQLTGGESTGGAIVAGTGAIGYGGDVQPIGGIVQKMHGAKRDGAQWFLAPEANCDEVVGNVPDGLEVWPVATLEEARAALKAISAGSTLNHPVCEAP
ncbi:MAG: S16 family serine protease [Actinomycetaceae bacterium]|nr:S16 family serine protease [Actinomycetaceae bacterium]